MSRPEVVPFTADHLCGAWDLDQADVVKAVRAERNIKEQGGFGWSAILDGKCIGYFWCLKEVDVYSVWLTAKPELMTNPLWFHRIARQKYKEIRAAIGDAPMRAICDTSIVKNVKWLELFGFEKTPLTIMEAK